MTRIRVTFWFPGTLSASLLAALLLAAPRLAASLNATAPDAGAPTARVAGTVVDESGKPAAGVLVEAPQAAKAYSTRTGADGRFELTVEGERYDGGLLRASTADGAAQTLHVVEADSRLQDQRLVLRAARQIPVAVTDAAGQPVAGAVVLAAAAYQGVGEAVTDAAGRATLRVPADASLMHVLATKPDAGLDYVLFWSKRDVQTFKDKAITKPDPYRLDPDFSGELRLTLAGAKKVTVRAVDEKRQPLAGVSVYPWYFQMPQKGEHLNLSGLNHFHRTTDDKGVAELFIPANNTATVTIWTKKEGYSTPKRTTWDPKAAPAQVEAALVSQLRVAGRVIHPEGKPAAGAKIWITGDNYEFDDFRTMLRAKADGTFEAMVDRERYYLLSADLDKLVSRPLTRMIRHEAPADPLVLKLEPGTRVFGRVTAGDEEAPAKKAHVTLILQDHGYRNLPEDQRFPGGLVGRKSISPSVSRHGQTDDEGRFEFFVAPGEYQLSSYLAGSGQRLEGHFKLFENGMYTVYHYDRTGLTDRRREQSLKVDPAKGLEMNLHADPAAGPKVLRGRVVQRGRPQVGVPDATVTGAHVAFEGVRVEAVTDRDGNFSVRRGASDVYLMAQTLDKKQRGIAVVGNESEVTIPVGPMATARGRLLDPAGKPLANRRITYGVRVGLPSGPWSNSFGDTLTTGADGQFVITEGLVPGFEYELNVSLATDENDERTRGRSRTVGKAKADRVEQLELGDFTLPDEKK